MKIYELENAAHPGVAVMNASDSEDEDRSKLPVKTIQIFLEALFFVRRLMRENSSQSEIIQKEK